MSYKVLISDSMSSLAKETLEAASIEVIEKPGMSVDELKKTLIDCQGLIVRSATKATKDIIESSSSLKVIGRAGAGVDNIDLVAAKENDVIVMNTPGGNTNATAEHAIGLMFAVYRHIAAANASTHQGLWEKKKFMGLELRGKKLGVIGFGNVAQRVAEIAHALGMEVKVFSFSARQRELPEEIKEKIKFISFEELISGCDIITLHGNSKEDGSAIIETEQLQAMKENAILVNAARGNMVDESALKQALESGQIRGAGMDVFSEEPATDNVLFKTPNLVLTPHIAASTEEAQFKVAEQIAEQIADYLNNGNAVNTVG